MKSKLFKTVKDIPFTVIGLPGSGKTTVLRLFGEQVGRETVSTDMIFDRERAKPDGKITLEYIRFAAAGGNGRASATINPRLLPNPNDFIGNYTNERFRDYEDLLIRKLFHQGFFETKYADFSSSFFLREENRRLLEKQGIITVFLDTPYEDILDHLFADTLKNYEHKKNNELIVRATLQAEIDLLSENGKTPSESEVKAIISRWAAGMLPRRSCFALADITVVPERGMNPGEISLITAKALLSFSK